MWRTIIFITSLALLACNNETAETSAPETLKPDSAADVDWTLHGNDGGEQRFSSLAQINRDTIDKLGLTWSFDMYTRRGVEATPLVVDGTMYVTGSWSMVYALDATSGELKWFYDPKVDRAFLAKGCCDAVNRGVAYANGKVIVGAYDGRLIALNAVDGSVAWDVQTTDRSKSYTITGAPRIAGDKVIIGNGGAELGVRGYVTAYYIDSGKQAWRFYTVPGNPADGFENEQMKEAATTWNGEWWKWGGGGTVWDSMVFDPQLNLFYIGVGNGSPWNQAVRSPGGGDNLFLASIVALRPDTGEYVWHYQTTPGETWDYTATQHIMLADLEIDGVKRKVLMQAPKNGFFYILDRATGELISAEKYTVVNWASHVDKSTGRPVETKDARVFDGKNISLPSNAGGHNWPPMSYNPETGLIYVPTMVFPVAFLAPTQDQDRLPGQGKWNVGFDRIANAPPPIPEKELAAALDRDFSGQLIAWDPIQKKARWTGEAGRPASGGVLSTAGGLVLQPDDHGHLTAYDAYSGKKLWSHDTQTGAMAPPITYSIKGEQYVAIAVGFGGGFAAEGGPVAHGWKVANRSRVLVYKLGGKHELPVVEQDMPTMPKPAQVTAAAEVVEHGKVVYHRHCSYCHGDGLRTGGVAKDLRWSGEGTHKSWQDIVIGGLLSPVGMVSFKNYLSADDAEAVRQYVLSEANRAYSEK
ncbi:MAG: PQQ-dependent dehydrogenase, methanol/ethanol family [Pseudomonadales bacterium]